MRTLAPHKHGTVTISVCCMQPGTDRLGLERAWSELAAHLCGDRDVSYLNYLLTSPGGRYSEDIDRTLDTCVEAVSDIPIIGLSDHAQCTAAEHGTRWDWNVATMQTRALLDRHGFDDIRIVRFRVNDRDWSIDQSSLEEAFFTRSAGGHLMTVYYSRDGLSGVPPAGY